MVIPPSLYPVVNEAEIVSYLQRKNFISHFDSLLRKRRYDFARGSLGQIDGIRIGLKTSCPHGQHQILVG